MKRKYVNPVLLASLALVIAFSGAAFGQVPGNGLAALGPVATGPLGLFPAWYMAKNGTAVEMCLDGPPNCLSTLADLSDPLIGEAFYWSATANLADDNTAATGFVEFALEAAFLNPVIDAANAMVFNRLRIRVEQLPVAGQYTLFHPYGRLTLTAALDGNRGNAINFTDDFPPENEVGPPPPFNGVLAAQNIGPFLRQAGAPAGFLGAGPDLFRPITGGPSRNLVRLQGPGGFDMSSNLFAVEGKLATNGGLSNVRANYSRGPLGNGHVRVFANSLGGQRITARVGVAPNAFTAVLNPVAGQVGQYSVNRLFTTPQTFSPILVRNTTDASRPTVNLVNVPDVVTITQATWAAGVLTVQASSSDQLAPRPVLTVLNGATTLGTGTGQINRTFPVAVRPATIRVNSAAGGTATAAVRAGGTTPAPTPGPGRR